MSNIRPVSDPSVAPKMAAAIQLLDIFPPPKIGEAESAHSRTEQARIMVERSRQTGRGWIEQRQARIDGAIAFLRERGVVVSVTDRQAEIRTYFVSANRRSLYAEELVEMAIEWGWVE